MQSSISHVEDDIQLKFTKSYDCIYQNNKEIQKQVTTLIKLFNIIESDNSLPRGIDNIAKKIGKKLKKHLELWRLYNRNISEESLEYNEELENVLKYRELLSVKKEIGDIKDDAEYRVKLTASNWDMDNLKLKKAHLEKKINLLNNLHEHLEPEIANNITKYAQDDFFKLKDLELDTDISEILIDDFEIIVRIISRANDYEPQAGNEILTQINY
jgi:uncharacterized protein (UPF0147 family)